MVKGKRLRHKYGAKKTELDGLRFDSKREAKRYAELKRLKELGEVVMVLTQVPFRLPGRTTYRADFLVFWENGTCTVEDVKGVRTDGYKLKKRQVEELYPVEIVEI